MLQHGTRLVAAFVTLAAIAGCSTPAGTRADGGAEAATVPDGAAPQGVTYWRDIAPIMAAACTNCHYEGGLGPFRLDTYADVADRAALVAHMTHERRMPPWLPDPAGCRPLQNPRRLTQAQIDLIDRWAETGADEGNMADYVAPPPERQVLPATGDIVVRPAEPYTPTTRNGGVDDYHCFIMDPNLTTNRDVVGLRIAPGNPALVHHVILFEVRDESLAELQALDDAEPGPGYTCFGASGVQTRYRAAPAGSGELADFNEQMVGAWAPGSVPGYFPATTGIRLHAGSRLVMQVHYNLSSMASRGMSDTSTVELFMSPGGVPAPALWLPMVNASFRVPAGAGPTDPAATVTANFTAPAPVRVHGVMPHMHLRGTQIRSDVTHANGTDECLINIPRWDFHWQQAYWFNSALRAQSGAGVADQLRLTCVYDNTPANQPMVDGVPMTPRDLTWGEGTNDEMCLSFLYVSL